MHLALYPNRSSPTDFSEEPLIFTLISHAQEIDKKGSKDNQLLSRIPGYYISEQTNKDFDSYTSPYLEKGNVWEGKATQTNYS